MKLATLCYVRRAGRTLMMQRVKKTNDVHHGKWNGLGGKLQDGESPEECAIREIKEESGLVAQDPRLCGLLTFPQFTPGDDWYVYVYEVTDFSGTLIECNEGILEWIDDSELLGLNLWEGDRIFLPWVFEKKFFSAKFCYEAGKLVSHNVVFHQELLK